MKTVTVGMEPDAVALADLDGDGIVDIVVAHSESINITVIPGPN